MSKKAAVDPQEKIYTLKPYAKPLKSLAYEQRKVFNPSWFQGSRETENYFEGWYFKNVSAEGDHVWSFIPGISLFKNDNHAFIQAIDGKTGETYYFRYPADSFSFSSEGFEVCVGNSFFSDKMMILDIDDGKNSFRGELHFEESVTYPTWYKRPGIMGWYRYMPFMECYHGVVSLDHKLFGRLIHNGNLMIYSGGRGYIEKDWGSSMPQAWVWMQSNHFDEHGTSFMLSVARIPWIGKTFTGFLGFFLHEGNIISFATYTGAKVKGFEYSDKHVKLTIKGNKYIIEVQARKIWYEGKKTAKGGLMAPVLGNMERVIHESIDSEIDVTIRDRKNNEIFKGTGKHSGFEIVGYMELLKK